MSIATNYMMINEEQLGEIMEMEMDDIFEYIEKLDAGGAEVYDADNMWDGLHFFLCGTTGFSPIKGNPLSEAVVGVHGFDEDAKNCIRCTENFELHAITAAMKRSSPEMLKEKFDPLRYRKEGIYPHVRKDKDMEKLVAEVIAVFGRLLSFYEKALEKEMHVIISIFCEGVPGK